MLLKTCAMPTQLTLRIHTNLTTSTSVSDNTHSFVAEPDPEPKPEPEPKPDPEPDPEPGPDLIRDLVRKPEPEP